MSNPLRPYLLGTGSWFLGFGIQTVMFAWLVTMVLQETPQMVGFAQMALLMPMLLLVLIGGGFADHFGGRQVALICHALATVPPLILAFVILNDHLSFAVMVGYGIAMGSLSAFLTPARDGLLNEVASGTVQQTVVLTTLVQFAGQLGGIAIASFASSVGAVPILVLQGAVFAAGVIGFMRIPRYERTGGHHAPLFGGLSRSIANGYRAVADDPAIRITVLQNLAMSVCFMGAFIVTLPLVVREFYLGGSAELGWSTGAFSVGLLIVVTFLSRTSDIQRPGRALITAQALGAVALGGAGFGVAFPVFVGLIVVWGALGGVAMSMSRTIVQERAPAASRARVMSFYTLSLMGAGPIGALVNGYLAAWIGPRGTLIAVSGIMLLAMVTVAFTSHLWSLKSGHRGD